MTKEFEAREWASSLFAEIRAPIMAKTLLIYIYRRFLLWKQYSLCQWVWF